MTEKNLYALNQVSKCNIAPENLEVSRAKITMYTKHFRQEKKTQQFVESNTKVKDGTVALETIQVWTLIIQEE